MGFLLSASIWKSCFLYTPQPSSVRMWVFWGQEPFSILTNSAKFLAKELSKCGVNCCLVAKSCLTLCNPLFPYQVYSALSVSYLLSSESGNCCLVAKSCLTLCHPMDCSPPGYSIHGISQARILEWVAISFSKGSSWPRDWTFISCIGRQVPYHWATREAHPVRAKNL